VIDGELADREFGLGGPPPGAVRCVLLPADAPRPEGGRVAPVRLGAGPRRRRRLEDVDRTAYGGFAARLDRLVARRREFADRFASVTEFTGSRQHDTAEQEKDPREDECDHLDHDGVVIIET